ncbi:MAG TPA: hypothetical protein PLV52_07250, partial [Candidatus Omnitrophota bacterium]|nr:hypothetical protein [Candidatus Omnitrophota bacterium]
PGALADQTNKKSVTIYAGDTKGEEIIDYSDNYNVGTTAIGSHTVYYYGTTFDRASNDFIYSYLTRTITTRDPLGANATKQVSYYTNAEKGEELINWSQEYTSGGTTAKTITTYTYGTPNTVTADCLREVTVYKATTNYVAKVSPVPPAEPTWVYTDQPVLANTTMKAKTYYAGDTKGEEIINYTDNYNVGTTNIESRTTYYYYASSTDKYSSASNELIYSYLTQTVTKRDPLGDNALKQISFYKNTEKGEELIDWSQEYSYDATQRKTTTLYNYGTPNTVYEDCLSSVKIYKDGTTNIANDKNRTKPTEGTGVGQLPPTTLKTWTYYRGDIKGEEIVNYVDNYRMGSTTVDSRTRYYYYATTNDRFSTAENSLIYSYLTNTVTRRGTNGALKQVSFYMNSEKGEELVNWSQE